MDEVDGRFVSSLCKQDPGEGSRREGEQQDRASENEPTPIPAPFQPLRNGANPRNPFHRGGEGKTNSAPAVASQAGPRPYPFSSYLFLNKVKAANTLV